MSRNIFKHTLLWFSLVLGVANSCKKDDVMLTPKLYSFGPTTVKHGDTIRFIGAGLDKIASIVMPVNITIPSSSFIKQTSSLIEVVVPQASTVGHVSLKTAAGDSIVSKTIFGAAYTIAVRSYTGSARPGSNVTINGDFLNYVKQVTFAQNLPVTQFVSQSLHQLVVQIPMSAKTGPVTLTDLAATTPQVVDKDTLENSLILNVSLPAATSFSPSSVKHADNLVISGTDLDLVTQIAFPGGATVAATNFVNQSQTQITVTVPVAATNGVLTLTAPSGVQVVTSPSITIILPVVTALSPSDAASQTPGATLTMTGTDLDLVGQIKFPGAASPVTDFTLTGTTQIDVTIPPGTQGGTLVLVTIHGFSLPVSLPFGNQLILLATIYDDVNHAPWGVGGGWGAAGGSTNIASTENPRVGAKSVKVTYGGDYGGGSQFGTWGNNPMSTSGASYFAFSIYGGAGTGGKNINVNISGVQKTVPIVEGAWSDVKIALSDVGNPATLMEVWFQDQGWSGTVYIDQIGLK